MRREPAPSSLPHLSEVILAGERCSVADVPAFAGASVDRLPWVFRLLLENVLRHDRDARGADAIMDWLARGSSEAEIAFHPYRLLMHDTTCVPALVDIAAMRSTLAEAGRNPAALDPLLPIDVSVDHSITVDFHATPDALSRNMRREIERNIERYRLLKWAAANLRGLRVYPPGTGIMHTINLERLATVVTTIERDGRPWAIPDTLIGTDSHTPMINGLGVLAWGVGGLEAEGVMFGVPVMLRVPEVVGVRLTGALSEGVLATDLALRVTEQLRKVHLAGTFVEFFGPGVSTLSCGERAVVANMAPEYGSTTGYFPIDARTIEYLEATGRPSAQLRLVEDYARRQRLWFDPQLEPRYTRVIEIDLCDIGMSLAGPRRPQDRLSPADSAHAVQRELQRAVEADPGQAPQRDALAIAAITSCTNTSDPRLMVAAGLVARKARAFGLTPPNWVKTSMTPGSPTAERYLRRAGLLEDLEALGFGISAYGCATCIGNSGALTPQMLQEVEQRRSLPVAVLSGNRNFPGRVHPQVDAGFLASPPLVVIYALAGQMSRNVFEEPIGSTAAGRAVFLRNLWPSGAEIDAALAAARDPGDVAVAYEQAEQNAAWRAIEAPTGALFPWDPSSTYLTRPPFAARRSPASGASALGLLRAQPLLVVGDDVTTDHISPAGQIAPTSAAAEYLIARGEDARDVTPYSSRRGNWEVMLRGLFTNRSVCNLLDPGLSPGYTRYGADGAVLPLWQAADRYRADGSAVVIVAGERYGAGSSRDWAAKGLWLLGVRAVLALSFERIHRSNLLGMGILPLQLPDGLGPSALALQPGDVLEINARPEHLAPRASVPVVHLRRGETLQRFLATAQIETALELEFLRNGGMLPHIIERALAHPSDHNMEG
jgi:aconitate hydratase